MPGSGPPRRRHRRLRAPVPPRADATDPYRRPDHVPEPAGGVDPAGGAATLRTVGPGGEGTIVGRIDRDPWELRDVDATLRENTLFEAAGLPAPADDPVFRHSPGFEMGVLPEEVHAGGTDGSTADATRRGE